MQLIELLWPAFVLAIVLVYIHTVFGLEIIRRGVIFTDLAVGQIASVGMALSITFFDGEYQNAMTFGFALLAAGVITWATKYIPKIEAFIGLLYAFGISSIMLILAKSAQGVELFSKLSAADILFTSQEELVHSVMIYGFVAIVMFALYPRTKGVIKEFLFFSMLALTVTSSVQSAGVLVVFALLIAPSYIGFFTKKPFLVATIFGSVGVMVALIASYNFDLPTGYTIIFVTVTSSLLYVALMVRKKAE